MWIGFFWGIVGLVHVAFIDSRLIIRRLVKKQYHMNEYK